LTVIIRISKKPSPTTIHTFAVEDLLVIFARYAIEIFWTIASLTKNTTILTGLRDLIPKLNFSAYYRQALSLGLAFYEISGTRIQT
jgi:hypothetical protein